MKDIFIAFIVGLLIILTIFMIELVAISQDLKQQVDSYNEIYTDDKIVIKYLQENCGEHK